jgi:cytochrome d ubiquinol oxidase subunit I
VKIPDGLSLPIGSDPNTVITGLDRVPRDLWPPVTGVHLSFDLMVGVGFFLLALGVWSATARWWRGMPNRVFLVLGAIAGPAAVAALECGWTVTEEERQPWVVQGVMSAHDAVDPARG